MFESLRRRIAKIIAPKPMISTRMYHSAKASRLTGGWNGGTTSADNELLSSLSSLRNMSRTLIRDASYAKRAKVLVQNNVIGTGVGMQAQVMTAGGDLRTQINDGIESAWKTWSSADSCHTGGALHFCDLERMVMGQVFEAGEAFIRLHYDRFGSSSTVPLALEVIEAERLADQFHPLAGVQAANMRLGIELDPFYRPVAYWFSERHPGELNLMGGSPDRLIRVPARDVIHLRIVDRWPQTRGEPWLHAVARKLGDMDAYGEAELVAARAAASYCGLIEPADQGDLGGEEQEDGSIEINLEPGMIRRLSPGDKFSAYAPNRPNTALDPFMRYMLREVAAGSGPSYESLSRDYSQSNYSSSRLALLDDRDLWRVLQMWWIRNFRERLHSIWVRQAVLSGSISAIRLDEYAIAPDRFEAVRFKPRGWSWIDPTKEVEAAERAVQAGFTTVSDVIAQTGEGRDLEDVLKTRERELALMAQYNLEFTTDPEKEEPEDETVEVQTDEDEPEDEPEDEAENDDRIIHFGKKR